MPILIVSSALLLSGGVSHASLPSINSFLNLLVNLAFVVLLLHNLFSILLSVRSVSIQAPDFTLPYFRLIEIK